MTDLIEFTNGTETYTDLTSIMLLWYEILGVQRSQSEKSKDKETFLANKAQQLPQKKPVGPTAKSEAVEIPGIFFKVCFLIGIKAMRSSANFASTKDW